MNSIGDLDHHSQLALSHAGSDDDFQRLLSHESAVPALGSAKTIATSLPRVGSGNEPAAKTEDVQQPVDKLDELVQTFEGLQTAARHDFTLLARPLIRKPNVLDLPDEILLDIFDHFGGWMGLDQVLHPGDIKTIQIVRLTCRRFCNASSRLLVPCLRLSPDFSSLKRLEQVTSHPTISRGSRLFSINARFHSAAIANDYRRYARMCYHKVREKTERLDRALTHHDIYLLKFYGPRTAVEAEMKMSRHIMSCWEADCFGGHVDRVTQCDPALFALRRGHTRYQEKFEEQEHILRDCSFARTVAAAAARSRSRVWLRISDEEEGPLRSPEHADPDRIVEFGLTQTRKWYDARDRQAHEAPQSLLYELPLEMHAAGAHLVGFRADISRPEAFAPELSSAQMSGLSEVAKWLRDFRFCLSGRPDIGPTDTTFMPSMELMASVHAYLSAAMGQQNVRNLYLNLTSLDDSFWRDTDPGSPGRYSIAPLLNSPAWPRIRFLHLHYVPIHLEHLKKLLDMLQPGVLFDFVLIHLLSGTWADALEYIRLKAGWGSRCNNALGAEVDSMTAEDHDEVFEESLKPYGNMASQYIQSIEGVENPLRTKVEVLGMDLGS